MIDPLPPLTDSRNPLSNPFGLMVGLLIEKVIQCEESLFYIHALTIIL